MLIKKSYGFFSNIQKTNQTYINIAKCHVLLVMTTTIDDVNRLLPYFTLKRNYCLQKKKKIPTKKNIIFQNLKLLHLPTHVLFIFI